MSRIWQDGKIQTGKNLSKSGPNPREFSRAQGLQQLRADSDHPKGVVNSGLRSTRGECLSLGRLAQLCTGKPFLTCISDYR